MQYAKVLNPMTGLLEHPVTIYGFDAYGQQTNITDANGHVHDDQVNPFGQQTSRTRRESLGTVFPSRLLSAIIPSAA